MDQLALQVASRVLSADIFVTHRPYLHAGSKVVSAPNVTACTLDGAIPLVALYFRAQHEFVLPTHAAIGTFRFQRGLYFWVGARELLPEAWRWFAACAQHSAASGDEKLLLLGGSLLSRISRALQERDEVQIALNQPPGNDSFDEALGRLDNVLISLMGAIDACARVAHVILKVSGRERTAAWQNDDWLRRVEASEPRLSAVVGPGTPGAHTVTILSKLRNSVHGVALQGTTLLKDGKMEALVGLPEEDEALILDAMDAMGGRASWGFRPIGVGRSHVEPAVLVDRLFAETIALLNRLMQETPVERLPDVTITPDMSQPPVEDPAKGTLDTFSEWNRLAIRWQLGF